MKHTVNCTIKVYNNTDNKEVTSKISENDINKSFIVNIAKNYQADNTIVFENCSVCGYIDFNDGRQRIEYIFTSEKEMNQVINELNQDKSVTEALIGWLTKIEDDVAIIDNNKGIH